MQTLYKFVVSDTVRSGIVMQLVGVHLGSLNLATRITKVNKPHLIK